MSKWQENRQPYLFPSAVKPKSSRLGSAMVLKRLLGRAAGWMQNPPISSLIFTLKHIPVQQMSSWLNCPGVVGLLMC